jgi:hypothetical protein
MFFLWAVHDFNTSFAWEGDQAEMADAFYYETIGVENIIRFNSGSLRDMDFQRADIDVQLHAKGRVANVSEKFRKRDYPDILLEIYSLYPNVSGWFMRSEASHLVCFMPSNVYWLPEAELKKAFAAMYSSGKWEDEIQSLIKTFPQRSGKFDLPFSLRGTDYKVNLIKAFNKGRSQPYDTISVSMPFALLAALGIPPRVYPL